MQSDSTRELFAWLLVFEGAVSIDISAFLNWKWWQAGFPGNRVEGEVEVSPLVVLGEVEVSPLVVGEGVVASLPLDPSLWSLRSRMSERCFRFRSTVDKTSWRSAR